jgi:hypothetical protein
MSSSIELASDDTAAPRHVGTGRRRGTTTHGFSILIEVPLRVGTGDEPSLGVPASDPVNAVVEKEETESLGWTTLVQRSRKPAAAIFELSFEHVSVEDAAVNQRSGDLFILVGAITPDKMPAPTGKELVGSWNGAIPVLFAVHIAVDAFALLEPEGRAAQGAQAKEEVGGHDLEMAI